MIDLDFTIAKYDELCKAIVSSKYIPYTVYDYLTQNPSDNCIILRHDVDRKPNRAQIMAEIEHQYGIRSTYYFRTTKEVFQPLIIKRVAELGHEIGYHYEVLDKAKGDFEKAIEIFEQELKKFRRISDLKTICMHGNPLTSWLNSDIWKNYDLNKFSIIGEAYLSIDYNNVSYFTDTGRAWNSSKHSVKDIVTHKNFNGKINSTNDLMNIMKEGNQQNICIVIHPNRWTDDFSGWIKELVWQNIKNIGKVIINTKKRIQ